MKIKTLKIHCFNASEYEVYINICKILDTCRIHYDSYTDTDDDNNFIWCIELEGD